MKLSRINPFYAARIARRRTATPSSGYRILDLFSGIGGFSLGLERAGMTTAAFCEIDGYCQRILRQHWPETPIYDDIRQLSARRLHHDGIHHIDLICGGYPCQPFSIAGKQKGTSDPRHLWPQMHRLIRELRPRWVVCENVLGHVELGLDDVLHDLEDAGYAATPFVVPACAVGAPHRRDRVWIVAHAPGLGLAGPELGTPGRQSASLLPDESLWRDLPAPFTCRDDDGIPCRVERTQALGNAVVPQIPELIGRAIIASELIARAERTIGMRQAS